MGEPSHSTAIGQVVCAFRLDRVGLARIFGQLEAQIMDTMWQLNEATVQDVCNCLGDVNYETILTVMSRLTHKGVLTCDRQAKAFVYQPTTSRDIFLSEVLHRLTCALLDDFGEAALEQIIETAGEVDPTLLDELEQLIRQKRKTFRTDVWLKHFFKSTICYSAIFTTQRYNLKCSHSHPERWFILRAVCSLELFPNKKFAQYVVY